MESANGLDMFTAPANALGQVGVERQRRRLIPWHRPVAAESSRVPCHPVGRIGHAADDVAKTILQEADSADMAEWGDAFQSPDALQPAMDAVGVGTVGLHVEH